MFPTMHVHFLKAAVLFRHVACYCVITKALFIDSHLICVVL